MSYLQYHLVFILPVLLVLAALTARRRGPLAGPYNPDDRWSWSWFWALPLVATVYTTPWDNYLVFREVWSYPPERVLGRLGYVPYEEYAFFILQTLISGLLLLLLMRRGGPARVAARPELVRWGGAALLLGLAFVGALCLRQERTLYLGLILAWAMPVLAGQWAFGGDLLLGRARLFWTATLLPTTYLWLTDAYAISNGIWQISPRYTVGLNLGRLPFEEMLFFLVTNLLVVTGLMLFLHPAALERLGRARPYLRPWLGFAALYLLLKIPVPLWPGGFPLLGTLSTGFLCLAALSYAADRVGWGRAVSLLLLGSGTGWLVEWIGSQTGLPFGQYSYEGAPAPTLLGVPLIVPLGWFAMTLVATLLSGGRAWLAGLLLVAWDLGLEPLMTSQGYWTWQDPHPLWSGAPLLNFIGWWGIGTALSWAFVRLAPDLRRPTSGLHPGQVYLAELLFLPGGLLLFGQPVAAGVTLVAMALVLSQTRRAV
ncbi:carotenoid biosynthesis protein [Deinococcus malanensis]|uniref:carotenoid biosynthesis protein n=1 Tax=Deinococcus malanensis TaxID=1706855 RepID=UPI0016690630|nr:carotenoid biosynthesis protein [Deinococcus malanensis]